MNEYVATCYMHWCIHRQDPGNAFEEVHCFLPETPLQLVVWCARGAYTGPPDWFAYGSASGKARCQNYCLREDAPPEVRHRYAEMLKAEPAADTQ